MDSEASWAEADEKRLAIDFNQRGYAVFDFPNARIDRIKANLGRR